MKNIPQEKIIQENFDMRKAMEAKGEIVLNALFDENIMENLFFKLKSLTNNKNIKEITININSNGGDATALFPLIDLMDKSNTPITTIVIGKAYSAGAFLLLCGHKGKRYAYSHSAILIHEVASNFGYSKSSQLLKDAKNTERINKMLIQLLKERTKMKDTEIKRFMNSNYDEFISAQQALKFGIIDKIL